MFLRTDGNAETLIKISTWSRLVYGLIVILCFTLFQQSDLFHTIKSSEAYLSGHFWDFYNYNKPRLAGNDYLPTLYLIFALWNLPLKLIGLLPIGIYAGSLHASLSVFEILWSKALLGFLFFSASYIVYLISLILTNGDKPRSQFTAFIFLTNPIAIFSVFIFGQYDIIGLFFCLLGFYFYLKQDLWRFSWMFSIAISCKFLALIPFIPLLLLREKRITKLMQFSSIALLTAGIEIAFYWHNQAFRSYTLFGGAAAGKLEGLLHFSINGLNTSTYLFLLYVIICLYAYTKEYINEADCQKTSVFVVISAFSVLFLTIIWHPQWLLYITPLFALATIYLHNKDRFFMFELFGVGCYFFIVVSTWIANVDAEMLRTGFFAQYFKLKPLVMANLLPKDTNHLTGSIFMVYLCLPLLMLLFQSSSAIKPVTSRTLTYYFNSRFIIGLGFFLVPALFCGLAPHWLPVSVLNRIEHNYEFNNMNMTVIGATAKVPVGEITQGTVVLQTFVAEANDLIGFSVQMATYNRVNSSHVYFEVFDDKNELIASHLERAQKIQDNAYYSVKIPAVVNSKGRLFRLRIRSEDAAPGNALTAWVTENHDYSQGQLTVNGQRNPGDLVMKIYYK